MTMIMNIFEIIGTIAFAISGSIVAANKKMDVFGILILGLITAVEGAPYVTLLSAIFLLLPFRILSMQLLL